MLKIKNVATSLLLATTIFASGEYYSSLDNISLESLGEINYVVGVAGVKESSLEAAASIYTVSEDELRMWAPTSFFDLVGRTPGFSYYNTDNYGVRGITSRGINEIWRYSFSFELMPLLDFGHWVFSPYMFKNIEVGRGPLGLARGSSAEAGMFNLNLRDDLDGTEAVVEVGNYGRVSTDIMAGDTFDNGEGKYFFGFHFEKQDWEEVKNNTNYKAAEDKEIRLNGVNPSWYLISKIEHKALKATVYKSHNDHPAAHEHMLFPTELLEKIEEKNGPLSNTLESFSTRAEFHILKEDDAKAYVYGEYSDKQWYITGIAYNKQKQTIFGFVSDFNLLNDDLNIIFSGQLYSDLEISSPSFNSKIATDAGVNWYGDSYFPVNVKSNNVFFQAKYDITDNYKVLVGGRADHEEDATQSMLYSPRLSLMYIVNNTFSLRYVYNKTYRRATSNERYFHESSLEAEHVSSHEFITSIRQDKSTLDFTIFNQELKDKIHYDGTNAGGVKSYGIESALKYYMMSNLHVYWNVHYHHNEVVGNDKQMSDGRVPLAPEVSSFLGGVYETRDVSYNLALRNEYKIPYFDIAGNDAEVSTYFVDLTLQSRPMFDKKARFSFVATNIFDNKTEVPAYGEHLWNANGVLKPEGRRFFVRSTIKF